MMMSMIELLNTIVTEAHTKSMATVGYFKILDVCVEYEQWWKSLAYSFASLLNWLFLSI